MENSIADVPPPLALMQLIRGAWGTQLVGVAAKLGVADLLASGPRTSAALAQECGALAVPLHRLLRGLAVFGVVAELDDGRFALTPIGELLRSDVPSSLVDLAIGAHDLTLRALGSLLRTAQTGEIPFEHAVGRSFFEHLAIERETGARFDRFMTSVNAVVARVLAATYDFSDVRTVADIGGGRGHFLAEILRVHPHVDGIVADLAPVVDQARTSLTAQGLAARASFEAIDFFRAVPAGADVHLLSWILHDWDDARCIDILVNCRRALSDDGRILVVEQVLPTRATDDPAAVMGDLEMLLFLSGRERTLAEYTRLVAEAGLRITRVVPLPSPFGGTFRSVIEARRA